MNTNGRYNTHEKKYMDSPLNLRKKLNESFNSKRDCIQLPILFENKKYNPQTSSIHDVSSIDEINRNNKTTKTEIFLEIIDDTKNDTSSRTSNDSVRNQSFNVNISKY